MRCRHALATFRARLDAECLAPGCLDPWHAWKVFKSFSRTPVDDVVDDVAVQYGVYEDAPGERRAHLYLVREFTVPPPDDVLPRPTPAGGGQDEAGEPIFHLVCDLTFPPDALPAADADAEHEFWSQDAVSLAAFVDRVESAPGFQALLAAPPLASAVYLEEA